MQQGTVRPGCAGSHFLHLLIGASPIFFYDFLRRIINLGFPPPYFPYPFLPSLPPDEEWEGKLSFLSDHHKRLCPACFRPRSGLCLSLFSLCQEGASSSDCRGFSDVATESALGSWVSNLQLFLNASPSPLHLPNPITCFQPRRRDRLTKLIKSQSNGKCICSRKDD